MWPKLGGKLDQGWLAVVRRGAQLDIAHVLRSTAHLPEVRMLESFAMAADETESLVRLAQGQNLKRYRCVTLMRAGSYRVVQMEPPAVALEERLEAMRWRLKDVVDFPVDDAALAMTDVPSDVGRQAQVFAVAAPRQAIGECMKRFNDAKLTLAAIDVPDMAVRNVAALFEETHRGLALLHLSAEGILLVITLRGELCLSRQIDLPVAVLAMDDEERRRQFLERLALELQRTLDNFDRQYSYIPVARLVVASEFRAAETVNALAQNLYLPVQMMNLAEVLEFPSLPDLRVVERQSQVLLAIGAALRDVA